jgi:hypothetical protein
VAPGHHRLADWIADNEALVLRQCALREAHPGHPRSTGRIETHLTWVRACLEGRKTALRNRRRLTVVLDLMRIERAGLARSQHYTKIVRTRLEELRHEPIDWKSHWDPMLRVRGRRRALRNTTIEHRDAARERNALGRVAEANAERGALEARRRDEALATAVAAGGRPAGRARRRDGMRVIVAKRGEKVAEVPELMAFWDAERNELDLTTLAAFSGKLCHWVCRAHEVGDPDGRWPGHLHHWTQTPGAPRPRGARARPGSGGHSGG